MYPQKKVNCIWSPHLAYIIGLLATDGCLSIDGRHIDFTSKDLQLIEIFKDYLGLNNKIGKKTRGTEKEKKYFRIQFGDINFYKFLLSIGLSSTKSKIIGPLKIKNKYFFDFLRGCIDGDGNVHTYFHPESKNPQLRIRISSASIKFLRWLQSKNNSLIHLKGWIYPNTRCYCLEYAMRDSINLLNRIYYKGYPPSLSRKFIFSQPYLRT